MINFNNENNYKDPKFKFGDYVRISKYKNIFAKCCFPNQSEKVFVFRKGKNTVSWAYLIEYINRKEIIGTFYEKQLKKTNQKKNQDRKST